LLAGRFDGEWDGSLLLCHDNQIDVHFDPLIDWIPSSQRATPARTRIAVVYAYSPRQSSARPAAAPAWCLCSP
jgi:hypothetical protein